MSTISGSSLGFARFAGARSWLTSPAGIFVMLILTLYLVFWALVNRYQQRPRMPRKASPSVDFMQTDGVYASDWKGVNNRREPPDRTKRAGFGGWGCSIYGWPSGGGVIIQPQADAIEMQYLGLDRLEPQKTRFKDQADEDTFCVRLMNNGGKWWPTEERAFFVERELNGYASGIEDETLEELRQVWVGWTGSGCLLVAEFQNCIGETKTPHDIGRLRLALTSEERCEMLKTRFGAVYYERPQDYPGFLDQHTTIFSRHRASS